MNEITNFLKKRRSVTAKNMNAGYVPSDHLNEILECGLRVPDHGALNPWNLNVLLSSIHTFLTLKFQCGKWSFQVEPFALIC